MNQAVAARARLSEQELFDIASEAYVYFYPLLSMEITRRQCTNLEPGKKPGFGPANQFSHMRAYPDADFKAVVRPNFDTLYSPAWIDLTEDAQVISIPDTKERYYLLPMLDLWTDVFASPGWRTSGTQAQNILLTGPNWSGSVPEGLVHIKAPTSWVWIIGRTKTDGPADYAAVHAIQDGLKITPLSNWKLGTAAPAKPFKADASIDMKTPPLEQVNGMSAEQYFSLASSLLNDNPPHLSDWSILARMENIGIKSGEQFNWKALDASVKAALVKAVPASIKLIQSKQSILGHVANGWLLSTDTMGVYGNYYLKRAFVSMVGLGANQPEDAFYPMAMVDSDGNPLDGSNSYVIHFDAGKLPPANAFWSITMYDKDGFQCANELNRFAISSWMPLKHNADGSLDIYLQKKNPGAEKEANWLPSADGILGVTMRLYAPQPAALNRDWNPPVVKKLP